MKIAHLVCRFSPYTGGMGVVAYEQVKRLAHLGHQVTVFTLSDKEKLDTSKINFNIKYLKAWPRLGNGGFCPQLFWSLRKFDIVQLHYPFFGAQEILWLLKKLKLIKAKLIIFYHMDASFNSLLLRFLSFKSRLIRNSLFSSAVYICGASLDYIKHSKIKKIYSKYPHKFIEIPFGTKENINDINVQYLEQFKAEQEIKDEKIVLFVGVLDAAHYFKGVPVLIEAMHILSNKNVKLFIIGDGHLREDYQKQVSGFNLQQKVLFKGKVSNHDLSYYYAMADICALPSTTTAEAFGLVLIEAKAFGCATIGSNLPGVRQVVGESGLLVKPADADDLADKIKTILDDNNLHQKFKVLALKEAQEKYNWSVHIKKLNNIYKL